jgi:hypothetical protein
MESMTAESSSHRGMLRASECRTKPMIAVEEEFRDDETLRFQRTTARSVRSSEETLAASEAHAVWNLT